MERLARLHAKLGDLWWYTILLFLAQRFGDVINMFVGLWIVPKYVPQSELGAVLPMMNIVGFIGIPLSVVSIPFLKFVAVFSERGELGKVKALIRDAFVGTAVFAVFSVLLAYFVLPLFFERLRIQNGCLMLLLIVVTIAGSVSSIVISAMDGLKMFRKTVWFQAAAAPLRLVLMLVCMPFRALSGYVIGQSATPLVFIVGSLLGLRSFFRSAIRPVPYWKEHGREMLSYTWPLVVSATVGAIAGNMDTLVIRHRLIEFESAGYYIITRFSDMSIWIGAAFVTFLFPLLAGRNGDDAKARKLLRHSLVGSALAGLLVTTVLLLGGRFILGLDEKWAVYSSLSPCMVALAVNGVLGMMANCVTTAFTARRRFSFFLYFLPFCLLKSALLYALTGYAFFDGILPASWIGALAEFNPCRLSFVIGYGVVGQAVVTLLLLAHAFWPHCRRGCLDDLDR